MVNAAYLKKDPFPTIPPALLNSADIEDYVLATGMIEPFDPTKLKPGSYVIAVNGEIHQWGVNGKKSVVPLRKEGDTFSLQPNSIAFVLLDTKLYLPDYIAVRFNLKINHVHKGLLLGTGPLVDPGFEGRLFIPLHNLTTNEYILKYNEGLIWVEFTKLSPNKNWVQAADTHARQGTYRVFPDDKKNLTPMDYIDQATGGNAVISSIPYAMDAALKSAKESAESARAAKWFVGALAGIGVLGVAGLFYQAYQLHEQTKMLVQDSVNYTATVRAEHTKRLQETDDAIKSLRAELKLLKDAQRGRKK